jgi:hypothetical protein
MVIQGRNCTRCDGYVSFFYVFPVTEQLLALLVECISVVNILLLAFRLMTIGRINANCRNG